MLDLSGAEQAVVEYVNRRVDPQVALDDYRRKGATIPDESWFRLWKAERDRRRVALLGVVHRAPFNGSNGRVSCCKYLVADLPEVDRLTTHPTRVTCSGGNS